MNVITNELPEEAFCLLGELLTNACKAMMPISRHFHGVSFHRSFVDQRVHLVTSGQRWHSWKNSHDAQASDGAGTKSSRSTPST
jgi:hypothetical protein